MNSRNAPKIITHKVKVNKLFLTHFEKGKSHGTCNSYMNIDVAHGICYNMNDFKMRKIRINLHI